MKMCNENDIARNYKTATTQEGVKKYCLIDEKGYVMTKTLKDIVQMFTFFSLIEVILIPSFYAIIFFHPDVLEKFGGTWFLVGFSGFTIFYILLMILFGLKKYEKYYLREEGLVHKKGFSEKIITYNTLMETTKQWKPLIYRGSLYFVTEQELVRIRFVALSCGVNFCLVLLKILGEEQITVENFAKMQQPGHWKEKREAKKELKKRKQYVKRNRK